MEEAKVIVAGVDGYRLSKTEKGWIAVILEDGSFREARTFRSVVELLGGLTDAATIGIDIPIGLPAQGTRAADEQARRFIGARGSSVFTTPPRPVLEIEKYAAANAYCQEQYGVGISSQAHALRDRILAVNKQATPGKLFEIHPEVSFCALAGQPLLSPKKSWNGQMERRRLLLSAGIELPDDVGEAAGRVRVDDLLDAAVAAWSAQRKARGEARSLPEMPERDEMGREVAIWY